MSVTIEKVTNGFVVRVYKPQVVESGANVGMSPLQSTESIASDMAAALAIAQQALA